MADQFNSGGTAIAILSFGEEYHPHQANLSSTIQPPPAKAIPTPVATLGTPLDLIVFMLAFWGLLTCCSMALWSAVLALLRARR